MKNFSTIIIYQNDKNMVEEPIPCCFAIFTNIESYKDKIILMFEDGENKKEIVDKSILKTEELIPKTFYTRKTTIRRTPLSKFLSDNKVIYQKIILKTISLEQIFYNTKYSEDMNVEDYALAVTELAMLVLGNLD